MCYSHRTGYSTSILTLQNDIRFKMIYTQCRSPNITENLLHIKSEGKDKDAIERRR